MCSSLHIVRQNSKYHNANVSADRMNKKLLFFPFQIKQKKPDLSLLLIYLFGYNYHSVEWIINLKLNKFCNYELLCFVV